MKRKGQGKLTQRVQAVPTKVSDEVQENSPRKPNRFGSFFFLCDNFGSLFFMYETEQMVRSHNEGSSTTMEVTTNRELEKETSQHKPSSPEGSC